MMLFLPVDGHQILTHTAHSFPYEFANCFAWASPAQTNNLKFINQAFSVRTLDRQREQHGVSNPGSYGPAILGFWWEILKYYHLLGSLLSIQEIHNVCYETICLTQYFSDNTLLQRYEMTNFNCYYIRFFILCIIIFYCWL